MAPQTPEPRLTQADLDARDLRVGRLTHLLDNALAAIQQLRALVSERNEQLLAAQRDLQARDERIAELEGILADLADDDDDEAPEDDARWA